MNIAKAAIVFNWPYKKKLGILEEHSSSTKTAYYKKHISNKEVQKAIDSEIRKLRFSRDLPRYEGTIPKKETGHEEIAGGPQKNAVRDLQPKFSLPGSIAENYDASENLYPPAIAKAFQERAKLYDQREVIGQNLIDYSGTMTKAERAANIARQKTLLGLVNDYSHFINKWKESGELDFAIIQKRPDLDEDEKEILLARFRYCGKLATKQLEYIKKAEAGNDPHRAEMHRKKRADFQKEQDEIGILINIRRRKPYEKRLKTAGENDASKAIES